MCLYPRIIKNKKYGITKKNKGNVPTPRDNRVLYVPIGCGKCIECVNQKKRAWQIRMHEELRNEREAKFITLTFSNNSILELDKELKYNNLKKIWENELATLAMRRFLERWRKKFKKSVKPAIVTGKQIGRAHV